MNIVNNEMVSTFFMDLFYFLLEIIENKTIEKVRRIVDNSIRLKTTEVGKVAKLYQLMK